MNCPLCKTALSPKTDKHYYKCDICHAFVKDKKYHLLPEEEKARYESHNNDVNDPRYQKFTSPITNYILEHFTHNHNGLDFGSGTGPVISKILKDNHYNIDQYDPFFNPHTKLNNNHYDYIVCCEVFEHFHNPDAELKKLANLLKPNGEILIMTLLYNKNLDFKSWFYRKDPTHIFIYQKETFEYIAKKMHFKIEKMGDRLICMKKSKISLY